MSEIQDEFDFSAYLRDPSNQVDLTHGAAGVSNGEADTSVSLEAGLAEGTPGAEVAGLEGGQARDELGRFASTQAEEAAAEGEQPADTEEAPEGETEEERAERLFAGRFRDAESLEQGYLELRKTHDQQITELRQAIDELRSQPQPQQQQAITPDVHEGVVNGILDGTVNPQQAALWALQNQQGDLYDSAIDAWYEIAPRQASRFERAIEMEAMKQELDERPEITASRAQIQQQTFNSAWEKVAQEEPEIAIHGAELMTKAGEVMPEMARAIVQAETPDEKAKAIKALYYMGRGMFVDKIAAAQSQTAVEQARAEDESRRAATAVSAQQNAISSEDAKKSYIDRMVAPKPGSIDAGLETPGR